MTRYETVIGLEVHAQLKTRSKVFCGCSTLYGSEPNTQTCPVCMGLPGSLPVLNKQVIHLATLAGLALGCTIRPLSHTARKNYFYPDLPKGYQISQFDEPLCHGGVLEVEGAKIGITRVHIEEDAGKSLHDYAGGTGVDFNRCGVGLIEIVSEPDLRSPSQARAYLSKLKQILQYLDVSDCDMEKGSLRVDANLSLREVGQESLGTKTEVKNMNSFRSVERALNAEVRRQTKLLDKGEDVEQVTMLWNDAEETAVVTRSKEDAHDYRYFPEPDLVPIKLSNSEIESIRAGIPELPTERAARFEREYGLNSESAQILTADKAVGDYYEKVLEVGAEPRLTAGWIQSEILRRLNESRMSMEDWNLPATRFASFLSYIADGRLNQGAARELFGTLLTAPDRSIEELIRESGLEQVSDESTIETAVRKVIAEHQSEVERYRSGQHQLLGYFMGQVMKNTSGKANPTIVRETLMKLL